MTRLSIVIPVYNGEKTIESLCKTLINLYANRFCLEIVLVNDYSRDSSHIICRRLHDEYNGTITYLRLAKNFGEHNAVMAGLNHATGDYCVTMDDDFQNPPEEVGKLLEEIKKGFDVVYTYYAEKKDPFYRNIGSRINDKMANIILKKPADLYLSSFKIMNRFLVQEIIKHRGPDPYIDGIILRTTGNIGKVQVKHSRREQGKSGYTLTKLVSLWGNMIVSYSLIPLRIMGIVGFILALVGVAVQMDAIITQIVPSMEDPTVIEQLNANMMFFRGLEFFALSVVGEYVGRIYLAMHDDPQFVIREAWSAHRSPRVVQVHSQKESNEHHDHPATR